MNLNSCEKCHDTCQTCSGQSFSDCLSCKPPLELQINSTCLCQPDQYWDGISCVFCDPSLNMKISGESCRCKESFYNDSSICSKCDSKCNTCVGGSLNNCDSCPLNSTLVNSTCICKTKFYRADDLCLPCHQSCDECDRPHQSNCMCWNEGLLERCKCPKGEYWDQICFDCHFSCVECLGADYFRCSMCIGYLLDGICFSECPRGFEKSQNQCSLNLQLSLSFEFTKNNPLCDQISNRNLSYYDKASKNRKLSYYNKSSKNIPYTLPSRGLYFPENSSGFIFKSKPKPLVAPTFSISIWLRVLKSNQIFSINSFNSFNISFETLHFRMEPHII